MVSIAEQINGEYRLSVVVTGILEAPSTGVFDVCGISTIGRLMQVIVTQFDWRNVAGGRGEKKPCHSLLHLISEKD
jgi:hypothetical protein